MKLQRWDLRKPRKGHSFHKMKIPSSILSIFKKTFNLQFK